MEYKLTPVAKYKQYIIVIKPVVERISKAKFGVHCAHASLMASINAGIFNDRFTEWYKEGYMQVKIIKQVKSLKKLENIITKSEGAGTPCGILGDAGLSDEMEKGEIVAGAVGPITQEEAEQLGIWRLSNYNI